MRQMSFDASEKRSRIKCKIKMLMRHMCTVISKTKERKKQEKKKKKKKNTAWVR